MAFGRKREARIELIHTADRMAMRKIERADNLTRNELMLVFVPSEYVDVSCVWLSEFHSTLCQPEREKERRREKVCKLSKAAIVFDNFVTFSDSFIVHNGLYLAND